MAAEDFEMTAEDFENRLAELIDQALASLSKDDVIASFDYLLAKVRSGEFDESIPPS